MSSKNTIQNQSQLSTEVNPGIRIFLMLIVAIVTFVFFAQKIVFINADLGRHLENGKVFLEQHKVISTNFYSYTEPDFPVINHHWGSGVLLYIIYKSMGFQGISLFYCLISVITVLLFYSVAEKRSHSYLVFFFFMICIPLIANRVEIRPEMFSMFLLGLYVFLLEKYKSGALSYKKLLIILPLLQLLWVNLHIFFVMGLMLIVIYGISEWLNKKENVVKNYSLLLAVSAVVCLLNPAGLMGALTPLTIFTNYAYMIAENQSIAFMQNRFGTLDYVHFEIVTLIVLAIAFVLGVKFRDKLMKYSAELLCLLIFSVLAFKAIRGIPVAAYFFLAFAPVLFIQIIDNIVIKTRKRILTVTLALSFLFLCISVGKADTYFSAFKQRSGLGLYKEINRSADFFKSVYAQGPIFNNYDIGGYLIFSLFPGQRVFVDNRPEAYSADFFNKIYNPMLEKEEVWQKMDSTYKFNCIYFFRLDETPYGQPFLIRRLSDRANWAPVYVDAVTLIFLRRNEQNKTVIQQFELPKEMFESKPTG